ncbi:YdeI/OmpD-associated family protein [Niabella yanshanensis]|uniref:YdeI/OmpD-associated family protein n=1 Tax=Niabella yanshanensis TaxID=577386 RepID=A0ABZ0W2E1_9BACT|nr:YdeI/OmpD-associated family protein [Niabella yanshanensis]WQD37276.1 YdeI/OmpD-associated family protein [Niabella yanshanensis]
MQEKTTETFYPKTNKEWRKWLEKNHKNQDNVWLVMYKKASGKPTISWSEAVDEALCFGWIDSTKKTRDEESSIQFFSKRKVKSTWSKINKEKVERLIAAGLMKEAGHQAIETARENGTWNTLDEVDALVIPPDLEKSFKAHKGSKAYFETLSKSVKKMILYWILSAKRPETRLKRVNEVVESAARQQKPKQF